MSTSETLRQDVGALEDFAPGSATKVEVAGHPVALVRIDDDFYAIGDTCTHANVSLSEGEIDAEERTLECWRHGSMFSLETGEPQALPATRPVPTFRVVVEDGRVVVEMGVEG